MAQTITPATGFQPEVGRWFTALEDVRGSLIEGVEPLSTETLARRAYAGANTIGTLLMHIGEAELFWVQAVIGGEALTREQREEYRFDIFGQSDAAQMEPRDIGYFRIRLERVRKISRSVLQPLADHEMESLRTWEDAEAGEKREFSVRWILNHLLEHEAHHRGQILLLRGALGH